MAELNGAPVDLESLQRLALINFGHFTTLRVEGGKTRGLPLHLERLGRDCRALFGVDIDRDQVRTFIRQAVRADPAEVVNLRVTVFDPALEAGRPGAPAIPHFLITGRAVNPAESVTALRLQSARYTREMPTIKHVGLCGTIRLRRRAQLAGFDDVVFTERDGRISEGATWNVGFWDGEHVVWPDAEVLHGVTMQILRRAHPDEVVRRVDAATLPAMDAAFATNAAIGVRAIKAIDGVAFDEQHPIVAALTAEYASEELDDI